MKVLKLALYVLTLVGVIAFIYYKWDELSPLVQLPTSTYLLLLCASFVPILANALYFKKAMTLFKHPLSLSESLGLTVINNMYSYLLPVKTGAAIRAVYLKKKYAFPYSSYASILGGNYLLGALSASFVALLIGGYFWSGGNIGNQLFLLIVLVFLSSVIATYAISKMTYRISSENKLIEFLNNTADALKNFEVNRSLLNYTLFAQIGLLVVNAGRLYLTFILLDFQVDGLRILMVQVLLFFSLFIAVTPGNLGLREGIIAFSASFVGVGVEDALLVAIVDRAALLISVFISGLIYSKLLLRDITELNSR